MTDTDTLRKLAESLRERTAMKFMGDCKCGHCQLVPCEMVADSAAVIEYAATELTALRAKVKRQAEALKPFADEGRKYDPLLLEDDENMTAWDSNTFKVRDLRRAQEASNE